MITFFILIILTAAVAVLGIWAVVIDTRLTIIEQEQNRRLRRENPLDE